MTPGVPVPRRRLTPVWLVAAAMVSATLVMATPRYGATHAQVVLTSTARISDGAGSEARSPRLALTGDGTIFVAWEQVGATAPGLSDIYYRYLPTAGGWQPGEPGLLNRFAESPSLATYGAGEVTVGFSQHSGIESEPRRVQYAAWNGEARKWLRPKTIPGIGDDGIEPDIAHEPDGTLWVTWISTRGGGRSPYYAKLRNGVVESGGTIDDCVLVNPSWPRIAVAADQDAAERVHVVWYDDQYADGAFIQHASREVAGTHWACDGNDLQAFDAGQARSPVIEAAGPETVCMMWQEGDGPLGVGQRQEIIRYCETPGEILEQSDLSARSTMPSLALAPADLGFGPLVVWAEQKAKTLWFGYSTPPIQTPLRPNSRMPDIVFDPRTGDVHAVWVEDNVQGGADVFYGRWSVLPPTATATVSPPPSSTAGASATTSPTVTATADPSASATPEASTTSPTPGEPTPTAGTPTATMDWPTSTATGTATPTATATDVVRRIYLSIAYRQPSW